MSIEVFKTNLVVEAEAKNLDALIVKKFPDYQVNFDLNDCDRVMRVVSPNGKVDVAGLTRLANEFDFRITPLPDEVPA